MNDAQLQIIELSKHPLNYGQLANADIIKIGKNLSCGDQVSMFVRLQDDIIEKITFEGSGCSISIAAASLLSESLIGKKLIDVQNMTSADIEKVMGMPLGPSRMKCAYLALDALQQGIKEYEAN